MSGVIATKTKVCIEVDSTLIETYCDQIIEDVLATWSLRRIFVIRKISKLLEIFSVALIWGN